MHLQTTPIAGVVTLEVVLHEDERGAFAYRRSVEDVADSLGVSRFTVYNYLNARKR